MRVCWWRVCDGEAGAKLHEKLAEAGQVCADIFSRPPSTSNCFFLLAAGDDGFDLLVFGH